MNVQTASPLQSNKGLGAFAVKLDTATPFRDLYLNRQAIARVIIPNNPDKSAERGRRLADGAFKAITKILAEKKAKLEKLVFNGEERELKDFETRRQQTLNNIEGEIAKAKEARTKIHNAPNEEVFRIMRGYSSTVPQAWVNQARFQSENAKERLNATIQSGIKLIQDIHDPRIVTVKNCGPCKIKLFDYFKADTLGLGFDPNSPLSLLEQLQVRIDQAKKNRAAETEIARLEGMIGLASIAATERVIHVNSSGIITPQPGLSQAPQKRLAFTLQIDLEYLQPSYLKGLLVELGLIRNQLYLPLPPDQTDPGATGIGNPEHLSEYIPVDILPSFAHLLSVRMEPSTEKKMMLLAATFTVKDESTGEDSKYLSIEGVIKDYQKEPAKAAPKRRGK